MVDLTHQNGPRALTAGEEDHSYPFKYVGADADAPTNPPPTPRALKMVRRVKRKLTPRKAVPRGARPWRNCNASMRFVEALNAKYPRRDKASDGTIGDAAHATRSSDHNPWIVVGAYGVVRARDVDKDGIDAAAIVEQLRLLGLAGDPRLRNGGYIIFNGRITKPDFSGWAIYTGANKHTAHFHISFSTVVAGFDSNATWYILGGSSPAPVPAPAPGRYAGDSHGLPTFRRGMTDPRIASWQRWYNAYNFVPALLPIIKPVANNFGPQTEDAVRKFQARYGLDVDGIMGKQVIGKSWDLGWRP